MVNPANRAVLLIYILSWCLLSQLILSKCTIVGEEELLAAIETSRTEEVGAKTLDLRHQAMGELPRGIGSLRELIAVFLNNNDLSELPEEIGSLVNLSVLNLSFNRLTDLPAAVQNLKALKDLNLSKNELEMIPDPAYKLVNLRSLHIIANKLNQVPESIGDLESLEILDLSFNCLSQLPAEIAKLAHLRELYITDNQIKSLPRDIGNLKELVHLHLCNNRLTGLPKKIGDLKNLQMLFLSENRLHAVPREIADLRGLRYLDLSQNLLTVLPDSIRKLNRPGFVLEIHSNPLEEWGTRGVSLGWRNLSAIFGDKVHFSEYIQRELWRNMSVDEFYHRLDAMPLSWNRAELKKLKLAQIPGHKLTREELMEIWSALKGRADRSGFREYKQVEKYINQLYSENPEENEVILRNDPRGLGLMKGLVEEALKQMEVEVSERSGIDDLMTNLFILDQGFRHCLDGKIAALNMVLGRLHGNAAPRGSLEDFIKTELAILKDAAISTVFSPPWIDHNVNILNYWKYRLRDDLGTEMAYTSRIRLENQREIDPFAGRRVRALDGFYSYFTPENAIEKLREAICDPKSKERLYQAGSFLMREIEASPEYRKRVFEFADPDAQERLVPLSITPCGVEDLLVKMEILCRREDCSPSDL